MKGKRDYADAGHYFKYPLGRGYNAGEDPSIPNSLYGNPDPENPYGFVPHDDPY